MRGTRDAYGIFPVLSSEKDNLYITMAARQLNPRIRIVARTGDVFNIGKKLFKGGANSVVSPNLIGGLRLVSEMVRPHVTEFLDEMMSHKNTRSEMVEIVMSKESPFCGLSLKEACLPKKYGLLIIAMNGVTLSIPTILPAVRGSNMPIPSSFWDPGIRLMN
jgi:voltage-gated potassium channel